MSHASPDSTPIDIILATYNGQDHIRAQLDSLIQQEHVHWNLWIRDDGSSDLTSEILDEYCRRDPRIHRLPDSSKRRGPIGNFGDLMQVRADSTAPYLFFCDQDDVWNPDKLTLQIRQLKMLEAQYGSCFPLAVHSDLSLISDQGALIHSSANFLRSFNPSEAAPFPALWAQNFVTGCTLAINKTLWELALPIPPEALMHDWWIALIATAVGHLEYWPHTTVYYRQHAQNVSGSARPKSFTQGVLAYLAQHESFRQLMKKRIQQSSKLKERLQERGYSRHLNVSWLQELHETLQTSPLRGALLSARKGVHMQGWARTLAFYLLLIESD